MTDSTNIFHYDKQTLVLGLGLSGYSCVKFLVNKKCPITVFDTRKEPPFIDQLKTNYSDVSFISAEITEDLLAPYQQIIVSPGISSRHPAIVAAKNNGAIVLGDLNLFIQENLSNDSNNKTNTPIIAVTGSNGKSTVVTLLEHIINSCDKKAIAGGNIGLPLLDLLEYDSPQERVDYYILELSSFQLETLLPLDKKIAINNKPFISASVLNISEDHMDRYHDLEDYRQTKEKIYEFAEYQIINKLDNRYQTSTQAIYFTEKKPLKGEYGLIENNVYSIDSQSEERTLWTNANSLKIKGKHNYLNIASALALLEPLNLNEEKIKQSLVNFTGLEHRCQWIADIDEVSFYNDSKGTNVGATIAAINSFDDNSGNGIVLIAGGVGKDADFTPLGEVIAQKVRTLVLFGKDATLIKSSVEKALSISEQRIQEEHKVQIEQTNINLVDNLQKAIAVAKQLASKQAIILFSPACASFDMFSNYIERGNCFVQEVKKLVNSLNTQHLSNKEVA